jgi:hypothetical protein
MEQTCRVWTRIVVSPRPPTTLRGLRMSSTAKAGGPPSQSLYIGGEMLFKQMRYPPSPAEVGI